MAQKWTEIVLKASFFLDDVLIYIYLEKRAKNINKMGVFSSLFGLRWDTSLDFSPKYGIGSEHLTSHSNQLQELRFFMPHSIAIIRYALLWRCLYFLLSF